MKQQLTNLDIYDIFNFPEDGDSCRFNKFRLTKAEFLRGVYLTPADNKPVKRILLYFIIPMYDEPTMSEILNVLSKANSDEVVCGCSSDSELSNYEAFLISIY